MLAETPPRRLRQRVHIVIRAARVPDDQCPNSPPGGYAVTIISIESLYQPALDTQRHQLDESRIRHYMNHPDAIRAVLVYENQANGERILVNGHHRVESAQRLGRTEIDADIRPGTRVDATLYRDLVRRPWSEVEAETGRA
jgi:hypothetical protein